MKKCEYNWQYSKNVLLVILINNKPHVQFCRLIDWTQLLVYLALVCKAITIDQDRPCLQAGDEIVSLLSKIGSMRFISYYRISIFSVLIMLIILRALLQVDTRHKYKEPEARRHINILESTSTSGEGTRICNSLVGRPDSSVFSAGKSP